MRTSSAVAANQSPRPTKKSAAHPDVPSAMKAASIRFFTGRTSAIAPRNGASTATMTRLAVVARA